MLTFSPLHHHTSRRRHAPDGCGEILLLISDNGDDGQRWDRFVAADPHSTFCHQHAWKTIIRDVLGHNALYLAASDETGTWRGVLPLVRVRSILGHFLISLPFLNDGGPLGDAAAREQLVEHATRVARDSGAGLLELRSRQELPGGLTSSYRKVSVHLPLPSSVDDLWKNTFRPKLRAQIRRPMKEGMVFRAGAGELDAFYTVFARNMRDLGTPVMPKAFFLRIAEAFGSRVLFGTVSTPGGKPVAGACCLLWRRELEVTWASSLREFNRLSPNMLLYGRLMEEAIGRDVTVFNFGRSTAGASTHKFKQQWGGQDVPLAWPSWSRDPNAGVPSADRPLLRMATTAWRQLPLGVANRFGPFLARLLP